MTFKNRHARAAQPSGGVRPSALAIDAGLATLTTFVARERSVFGNLGLTRTGTAHAQQNTKGGRGLATTASATYWNGAAGAKVVCAGTSFAVLLSFQLRAPGQTGRYALFERLTGGTGSQNAVLYGYATDQFEFYSPSATGTDPRTGSGITVSDSLPHTLIYTYDGATWSGLLDGRVIFSTGRSFTVPLNDATGISAIGDAAGGNSLDICVLHHATFSRGLPLNLARRLSSPGGKWSLFAGTKRRIWAVSAGGSSYSAALTESATASDASTAAYIATASVTDSITATDSLAAATTWVRSLTEAATAAESVTTAAGTFAASITEPASVADALTSAVTWARTLTEAASASDLATAIVHAVAALTEAATASDSQATGSIYTGSLTEAASVSDALTAAATLVALLTEVATASDAATSAATWVRLLTEPATAVDSVAGAQGATYTASVTEVLAAAELLVAVLGSTEALGRYTIAAKARRLTITAKPRRLEIRK